MSPGIGPSAMPSLNFDYGGAGDITTISLASAVMHYMKSYMQPPRLRQSIVEVSTMSAETAMLNADCWSLLRLHRSACSIAVTHSELKLARDLELQSDPRFNPETNT